MAIPRNYFSFVGDIKIPTKTPMIRRETITTETSSFDKVSLNVGIKDGGNCVFVQASGIKNKVIKTYNTEGSPIEVAWADRLDPDVIKSVAGYRKWSAELDGERREFITELDFVEYLEDALPLVTTPVFVRGVFTIRPGKTRNYDTFSVQHISLAKEDEKPKFKINAELFYKKADLDKSDKETGKWYLPAYVEQYVSKDDPDVFMPLNVVFNSKVFDMDKPKHVAQYNTRVACLEPKQKGYIHMKWELNLVNGAETVDFDESLLTPLQKALIDCGDATLESFKPKGAIFGNSVHEYRLGKIIAQDDFKDGVLDAGYSDKEFEEKIYHPVVEEKLSDVIAKADSDKADDNEDDSDTDDLF